MLYEPAIVYVALIDELITEFTLNVYSVGEFIPVTLVLAVTPVPNMAVPIGRVKPKNCAVIVIILPETAGVPLLIVAT